MNKCPFLKPDVFDRCEIPEEYYPRCDDNPKCIYRELQQVKNEISIKDNIINHLADKNVELQKEVNNLKNYIIEDLSPHTKIYINVLKDIARILENLSTFTACDEKRKDKILEKIKGVLND